MIFGVCVSETKLVAVGMGLIETPRFLCAIQRRGRPFLERLFTVAELEYAARKRAGHHNLAARFAAKCAGRSVLRSAGLGRAGWREVEVTRRRSGEPALAVYGEALAALPGSDFRFQLSLTHDEDFAMASVWLERFLGAT